MKESPTPSDKAPTTHNTFHFPLSSLLDLNRSSFNHSRYLLQVSRLSSPNLPCWAPLLLTTSPAHRRCSPLLLGSKSPPLGCYITGKGRQNRNLNMVKSERKDRGIPICAYMIYCRLNFVEAGADL